MKEKVIKIFKIILNVLLYVFVAICLFAVILSVVSKKDADGTANLFGYQVRFVQSPSMEKCEETDVSAYDIKDIPVKSLVFIQTVPEDEQAAKEWYSSVKVGDVLTFKYVYTRQETITHRVTAITPKQDGSGYIIALEGDNKSSDSNTLTQTIDTSLVDSPNYIIGRVTGVNYPLGLLVYALRSPVGIVCIVIVPSLIIITAEVVRIVNVLTADKKEKRKQEQQAQKDELEELRRRLAQLEGAAQGQAAQGQTMQSEPKEAPKEEFSAESAGSAERAESATSGERTKSAESEIPSE